MPGSGGGKRVSGWIGGKRVCVCDSVGCKRGGMRVSGGGGKQMVNSGGV